MFAFWLRPRIACFRSNDVTLSNNVDVGQGPAVEQRMGSVDPVWELLA